MSWLERKGPFVGYSDVACPRCNGTLIEFDIPVSDIIITDTFCESCDYSTTNSVEVIGEKINEMPQV